MRVVFHADASPSIGTGHVMRCLALAAALRKEGAEVTLASDEMIDALTWRANAIGVRTVSRKPAPDLVEWVVFDGYHLDARARSVLAPSASSTLVIDDLEGNIADAALILNQNLYATPGGPTRPIGEPELLAGPAYALLRPEFAALTPERPQPDIADRFLVTMGGADPGNATATVMAALADIQPSPDVRIIIGAAHPSTEAIEQLAAAQGFAIVRDADSLAPHLAWADLVISGCGTSVLESARAGRPIIGIVLAANQRAVADAVERQGIGVVAGTHPGLSTKALADAVRTARADRAWRQQVGTHGPVLVDGAGASRVAGVMRTGPLRLRTATMDDAELLLGWRNEPATRDASFDTRPIDSRNHRDWLAQQLGSPSARIWIGLVDNAPVGTVRYAIDGPTATVSVAIAAERRSAGIGARLISMGCTRLAMEGTVRTIDAWIRRGNVASEAAFRRACFILADDLVDRRRYRLTIEAMG